MTVRTRFSPSPTGMIHLGNARAALFSALYAKHHDGIFILRIEDTDGSRSEEQYVDALQQDLHWLGVNWQEGPGVQGPVGPYWQSQRQEIYAKYYAVLEKKSLIYPCFCTEQELMLARKVQLSQSQAPRYSGKCAGLTREEVEKRIAEGKKPAWRFAVPANHFIDFVDEVKGPQRFNTDDIGDFIVRRADGTAPFLFCNAVDDAEMKVTHVLRGDDHLANTPRQILLLEILGLSIPKYGHLSTILGNDGAPLSKRHGSFSLRDMREAGFLSHAILNYLARLGHACETQKLLDFPHLAKYFHLEKLSRSAARFDASQLRYWQKTAVQSLDEEGVWRWLGESVANVVPLSVRSRFAEIIKMNVEFPEEALEWAKIFFHEKMVFDLDAMQVIRQAGEQFFVEAEQAVDQCGTDVKLLVDEMKKTLGLSGKSLFMPLRVALTGKIHGPELAHIAELLGKEKMKHRLGQAFKLAGKAE